MHVDRRALVSTGLLATGLTAATLGARAAGPRPETGRAAPTTLAIAPDPGADQTAEVQDAIDEAARQGLALTLLPGRFRVGALTLRPNTHLVGSALQSVIEFSGGARFITARDASGVRLEGLVIDGRSLGIDAHQATGLLSFEDCDGLRLRDIEVLNGLLNGIALARCGGTVSDCTIRNMSMAGLLSLDGRGLDVSRNEIADCANNGILIWRSTRGHDGSTVDANRISRIAAKGGGSGQNGNGINVFRAGGVTVTGNHIVDCAFSAVRGNGADNIRIAANTCLRLGEVALYAEFGFEGALIANNIVDHAASGIAVTNFNEGGRLAVVQGNLVRGLFRREHEPVDKRGVGISIEADAAVTGNVIEGAPTAGIMAGWGPYLRDVAITGNLIREAEVGILVSSDPAAGACLVGHNMIAKARDGAIRAMDHGVAHGPDLASTEGTSGRLTLSGNLAV